MEQQNNIDAIENEFAKIQPICSVGIPDKLEETERKKYDETMVFTENVLCLT